MKRRIVQMRGNGGSHLSPGLSGWVDAFEELGVGPRLPWKEGRLGEIRKFIRRDQEGEMVKQTRIESDASIEER